MSRGDRRSLAWWVALVVVVIANTVVMWSDAVAAWWSAQVAPDDDAEGRLPGPLRVLIEARPDVGDAELHALAWSVPAFVVVFAAGAAQRHRRALPPGVALAVVGVWVWSVLVEVLQPVVSETRAFEWVDVVGNTAGVVTGAAMAWWWKGRRARSVGRHGDGPDPVGTIASGGEEADAPRSTTRDR